MKKVLFSRIKRLGAGIIAALLALNGVSMAHATSTSNPPEHQPFTCDAHKAYTVGIGLTSNKDRWEFVSIPLNKAEVFTEADQSVELLSPPDVGLSPHSEFTTATADYTIISDYGENYPAPVYSAADYQCNMIFGYAWHPTVYVDLHDSATFNENQVRKDLREHYPDVFGKPLDSYLGSFTPAHNFPSRWQTGGEELHVEYRFNPYTKKITFITSSPKNDQYDWLAAPVVLADKGVFYKFPFKGNTIERLDGNKWVALKPLPFTIMNTMNYLTQGVVIVEPDEKTSHYISWDDLENQDYSHIATSTITNSHKMYEHWPSSPFSRLNVETWYTLPEGSELSGDFEGHMQKLTEPVEQSIIDDFSHQLGYHLSQSTLLRIPDIQMAIPSQTLPRVTRPETNADGLPQIPQPAPAHTSMKLATTDDAYTVLARAEDGYVFDNGQSEQTFTYPRPHQLLFDTEGGAPVDPVRADYGQKVSLPVPSRPGFQFMGWFTTPDGKGERLSELTLTTDTTVYASWKKAIPITDLTPAHKTERNILFRSNDPQDVVITVHAVDGDSISTQVGLTRQGYRLVGWADHEGSAVVSVPVDSRLMVDGDRTLYAVWEQNTALDKPSSQKPVISSHPRVLSEASSPVGKLASTGSGVEPLLIAAGVLIALALLDLVWMKWCARRARVKNGGMRGDNGDYL